MITPKPTNQGEFGLGIFGIESFGFAYPDTYEGQGPYLVNPVRETFNIRNEATVVFGDTFAIKNEATPVYSIKNPANAHTNWNNP